MSNPIRYDSLLVRHLARELHGRLRDRELEALHFDQERRLLFLLLAGETLAWNLHPLSGSLAFHPPVPPLGSVRAFSGSVRSVEAPTDERLLLFRLERRRGRRRGALLVVELMTNQWNAVLQDEREGGRIVECLWRRRTGNRTIARGRPYEPPPPSGRRGLDTPFSLDEWTALLGPLPPEERRRRLVQEVALTSPLNAPHFLGEDVLGPGAPSREPGEPSRDPGDDGSTDRALEEGRRRWLEIREREEPEPCVLLLDDGPQPYPFPLAEMEMEPAPTLLAALEQAEGGDRDGVTVDAGSSETEAPKTGTPAPLLLPALEALRERAREVENEIRRLEEELASLPPPEELRAVGDLLLARVHEVPAGAERVTLDGFDGSPEEVELDPRLSAPENAERYYDEASRAERGQRRIPRLLEEARQRARRLEELASAVEEGRLKEDVLEEIRVLVPEPDEGREADEGAGLPYQRFHTSGGLEVRVGRSAAANDDLTFHHSRPDDIWLHARHAGGAHVILRWDGDGNPPRQDLAEAATLAALHSRARGAGTVPVDWTRRKYVRKPRKSPPGTVVPDRVQTLFVRPSRKLAERLRVRH